MQSSAAAALVSRTLASLTQINILLVDLPGSCRLPFTGRHVRRRPLYERERDEQMAEILLPPPPPLRSNFCPRARVAGTPSHQVRVAARSRQTRATNEHRAISCFISHRANGPDNNNCTRVGIGGRGCGEHRTLCVTAARSSDKLPVRRESTCSCHFLATCFAADHRPADRPGPSGRAP